MHCNAAAGGFARGKAVHRVGSPDLVEVGEEAWVQLPVVPVQLPAQMLAAVQMYTRRSKNLGFTTLVRLKKTISGDFVRFRT